MVATADTSNKKTTVAFGPLAKVLQLILATRRLQWPLDPLLRWLTGSSKTKQKLLKEFKKILENSSLRIILFSFPHTQWLAYNKSVHNSFSTKTTDVPMPCSD